MLHPARQLLPRAFRRLLAVTRAQLVIHQQFGHVPAALRIGVMAQRRDRVVDPIRRRESFALQQNRFGIFAVYFDRPIDQLLGFMQADGVPRNGGAE